MQEVRERIDQSRPTPAAPVDVQLEAGHEPARIVEDTRANVWLGPSHPGLEPLRTLQNPFVRAVSYRAYRLLDISAGVDLNEMGKVFKRANNLRGAYPHISNFSGRSPSRLLAFLKQFKIACDLMGIHEGPAVRVISFFLEEDEYRFYATQMTTGHRLVGAATSQIVWPVLVHRLLKRYCTEDVLSNAYDKVARAKQR